jgi:hypothetical protein
VAEQPRPATDRVGRLRAAPVSLAFALAFAFAFACSGGNGFIGGEHKKGDDDDDGKGGELADPPTDVTGSYLECGKYRDQADVVLVGCAVKSGKTKKKLSAKDCSFDMRLLRPNGDGGYEQYAMQTIKPGDTSPFHIIGVTHTPADDDGKVQAVMTCAGQPPVALGATIRQAQNLEQLDVDGDGDGGSAQAAPIDVDDPDRITPFTTQAVWDGGAAYFKLFAVVDPDDFCLPGGGVATSLLQTAGGQQKVQQASTVFLTINPQIPHLARSFDRDAKACFKTFGLIGRTNFITDAIAQASDAEKQWAGQDQAGHCLLVRVDDSILVIDRGQEGITPAALLESVRRISYRNHCK